MPEAVHEGERPRMRIGLFGNFGTLNTGNESTLTAILTRLRSLYPEGEFFCVCNGPESVRLRDGIDAIPITTRTVRMWDRERALYVRMAMLPIGIAMEVGQWIRAVRILKRSTTLIVPGTGLLTDVYGLSGWGPYGTMKWSVAAKLGGCKVFFVSVGAGPLYSRSGRFLVKSALALADYRSFRDRASIRYLEGIGFRRKNDPVYPDLAFGLRPNDLLQRDGRSARSGRRVVGLGLMEYPGRYSVEDPSPETFSEYLNELVTVVEWLLARNYDVKLVLGDDESQVIDEFTSLLRRCTAAYSPERVSYQAADSVEGILSALAATDVVVATRFHNVLLSLLLNRPVIAISFHHKCVSLMNQMGLSEYCHDISHMNAGRLIAQFQELERNSSEVRETIRESVEAQRRALDEQYARLFD